MLDVVSFIISRIKKFSDKINGSFYPPFSVKEDSFCKVVRGKIEVDNDVPVSSIPNIVTRIERGGRVIVVSDMGLPVVFEYSPDTSKIVYYIYVPRVPDE